MQDKIQDLWLDIGATAIIPPASIVKTQAAALSQKSKGLLQGEVESWTRNAEVHHQLSIVVPALDNYRYGLLKLHHLLAVYPVYIDESPLPKPVRVNEEFDDLEQYNYVLIDGACQ